LWQPEGAFYVFPKIKNSNKAVNELYYKHKIIAYDGAWFGEPDRVRFSYALDVEKIEQGLVRLGEYLKTKD
jgi:aspartate aminotransferase